MARKGILTRTLSIVFDRASAARLKTDMADAMERAGKSSSAELEAELKKGGSKGARALTTSLQREFGLRRARLNQALAEGSIDEKQFRKEGEKAAREFNAGLANGIKKLRVSEGGLSDAQFAGLGSRYKTVGGKAGGLAGLAGAAVMGGPLAAPLAGLISVSAAINEGNTAFAASDRLDASVRKLGGTARLAGIDLGFLEENSTRAQEAFRVSIPFANDLTAEVVKLTSKSGDINQTFSAMESFLNIGAARGMGAQATLEAVGQAIVGIDEGTDKLFGKNPSTIYEEYALKVGLVATKMTDAEKAQALLDAAITGGARVRGQYNEYLEDNAGKAEQNAKRVEELRVEMGKAIQPAREIAGALRVGFYSVLSDSLVALDRMFTYSGRKFRLLLGFEDKESESVFNQLSTIWRADAPPSIFEQFAGLDFKHRKPPPVDPPSPDEIKQAEEARRRAEEDRLARIYALWHRLAEWERAQEKAIKETPAGLDLERKDGGAGAPGIIQERTLTDAEEMFDRFFGNVENASLDMAAAVSGGFQDMFALMIDEGATVGNFFAGLGIGIAGAMASALADYAGQEAQMHFAKAIGAGAEALGFMAIGNAPSASAAWASAAQHTAAGVAFSALAGGAAAGQGAMRNRSPGSTHDAGLSQAETARRDPQMLTIYMDPFNPANPVHVRQIGKGMELDVRLSGRPDWAKSK